LTSDGSTCPTHRQNWLLAGSDRPAPPCGDRQHAAGSYHAPHFLQESGHVGGEEHAEHAQHRIEAATGQPGPGSVTAAELDIGQSLAGGFGPGQLQHRCGRVNTQHPSSRSHGVSGGDRRRARAAAKIQHGRRRVPAAAVTRRRTRTGPRSSARSGCNDRRQPRRCPPLGAHAHDIAGQPAYSTPAGQHRNTRGSLARHNENVPEARATSTICV
jgi:hypothetical protein